MKNLDWTTWQMLIAAAILELMGDLALRAWAGTDRFGYFTGGLILYGGALTLFAHLLRRAELAVIFALWVGVAGVLITLLGWLVFNEPLSPRRLLGLGLILTGVILLEV